MPPSTVKTTKTKPRTPWQRLLASIIGIAVVLIDWRWAVYHLYTLPEHSISAFTSITNNAHYVIGSIVIFMITGKLIFDWKNSTQTVTEVATKFSHSIQERLEHVIEEGTPGAPEVRPWTQHEDEP